MRRKAVRMVVRVVGGITRRDERKKKIIRATKAYHGR